MIIVVMGVSGSGKTTVGERLAARLGCGFSDADQFHGEANKAKMARGIPLTDEDRWPWLQAMHQAIEEQAEKGGNHVFACSALKRQYRDLLRGNVAGLMLVFLHGPAAILAERVARRRGHFFDPALLEDQLQVLEAPGPDEALALDIRKTPAELVERIIQAMKSCPVQGKPPSG